MVISGPVKPLYAGNTYTVAILDSSSAKSDVYLVKTSPISLELTQLKIFPELQVF